MTSSTIVVSVAATYLIACLVIGWRSGRDASDTATGWVAGDRAMGTLVMYFITGATIFSAFAFLGAPGRSYSKGAGAFFMLSYGALGFIPFYWLGPRAARLGRAFGFVTQAEMVAARWSRPALAGLMALISTAAFVPYLALQMKGAGYVLEAMTAGQVSQELGAAIVYLVVLVYVLKSGVLGVGWTNTFQGILMMGLAWAMGLYLPYKLYGGVGEMFTRIAAERPELLRVPGPGAEDLQWGGWGQYSSDILVTAIGFSVWPHLFMKAFSARSERTLRRTVVLYPTFQFFMVPLLILGFAGVLFESAPESVDQILPHLMMNSELPSLVVGVFCAGALAASMSSGDAMAHATASILVRDGWKTALGRSLDVREERTWTRVVVVVVLVSSYALAILYTGNIVDLLLYAYGPVVQFAPVILATLFWRRARGGAVLAGLAVGIVINVLFAANADWRPFPLHAGLYGLVANALTMIVFSMLSSAQPDSDEEKFLAALEQAGE